MKPAKISKNQTNLIDLGTKKIYEYPLHNKDMSIAYMVVDGRHPKDEDKFLLETKCNFIIYVTKGTGKIFAGEEMYDIGKGDAVFVPANNKFACEGKFEYVTFDHPGFFPEQSSIV